jgi:3-deoxy-manno-octulosonate cytidylyltransferase (CMP-KDO synthetase)
VLTNLADKPLLEWVWNAARSTGFFNEVLFAVDAQETADLIKSFGGQYIMTSPSCATGTDRVIEVMQRTLDKPKVDVWVNWQADEPFISTRLIAQLLTTVNDSTPTLWTLKKRIVHERDITSPNIAKVVCDANGYALYFSRSPIPFYREGFIGEKIYYKHIGLFAYTTKALQKISQLIEGKLEDAEKLEQLRLLEYGLSIQVHETDQEVVGIDTPEDLVRAEKFIKMHRATASAI